MTCAWCDRPGVEQIVVEPARYHTVSIMSPKTGKMVNAEQASRFAITVWACRDHLTVRDREGGTPVGDPRRRHAKGVEQLDIFGGSSLDARKPNNAIGGVG